jgi:branched-chain amino acid transport system ATP-binding protein
MSTLAAKDLKVQYGSIAAVRGVSLECHPGEIVALLGSNGAGKSSTLLAIAGALDKAKVEGTVTLNQVSLRGQRAEEVTRRGIVLVPERRRIFGTLSVRENLLVGASSWANRKEAERYLHTVLPRFPVLAAMGERPGGLLSGGQQQQLAIARGLMARPKILLLDEPSLGLSPDLVQIVFEIVRSLRDEGIGVLLVEQNVLAAMDLADRSFVMRKGEIVGRAEAGNLDELVAAFLGEAPPVKGLP